MSKCEKFYSEFAKIRENEKRLYMPEKATYDEILNFLKDDQKNPERDPNAYSNWKKRYTLGEIGEKMFLFVGDKRVVIYEELFDILQRSHVENTGHGGRDIMYKDLASSFYGISTKAINIYIKMCGDCELKKARVRKSLVVKPITEKNYNDRMQADLIDLQTTKDGEFKYILNMQVQIFLFIFF